MRHVSPHYEQASTFGSRAPRLCPILPHSPTPAHLAASCIHYHLLLDPYEATSRRTLSPWLCKCTCLMDSSTPPFPSPAHPAL